MIRLVLCLCAALCVQGATPLFQEQSSAAWTPLNGSLASDDSVRHNNQASLRVEATAANSDASARSAAIHLTIGKTYEVSGWVRTQGLTVKNLNRSPIASGAALTMESMPFDVHSASIGGTEDWMRLSLRFVATRSEDHILITAGNGGALQGKAWFEGVTLDEVSPAESWPAREAVQTFGPAYRYPAAGWIYLHIEGKPYDRGYQHGYLMAKEIPEYLTRCAILLGGKADEQTWNTYRTTADALFLRGFDREILEEMRGIADGANARGAKFLGRKLDLVDIVLANTTVEMGELASAMQVTPTGIEGTHFNLPPYASKNAAPADHCSAFAATGAATRDGKMVIGHVTWWPQTLAEQTNVMLDIKPEAGHRMLIQSYPGGIESGTDWYQNDAGIVLTETTIDQTAFNVQGTPVAFRARMAIQYSSNIDDVVKQLGTRNNGLYTNEWIIGDAKNNEIAMYELGTNRTKLWRSSKNEWFGNTPGFYWGDNNAKDLAVNLEYMPDPQGAPGFVPYVPGPRDLAWMDLYQKYKGQIDEQFGFKAFDSAPLVAASTMDSKVITSDMANRMMVWAEFGRPNESVAPPHDTNYGLFPGGYYVFDAEPSQPLRASIAANEKARVEAKDNRAEIGKSDPVSWHGRSDKPWKGWVLPASDADTWFVAGSAEYYRLLRSDDVDEAIKAEKIRYRGLKLSSDTPINRFRLQETAGALFLDSLRRKMGDDAFLKLMNDYFAAHTTQTVTAQSFLDAAGTTYKAPDPGEGPAYLPGDVARRLASAVIVYGTAGEAGTNRYVAEQLQLHYRERYQREVPIFKDFETSDGMLATKDVIFVGRPETNSALAAWRDRIGLDYQAAAFTVDGKTYASERNALVYAAKNPHNASHMVVVYAGNSPLETARAIGATGETAAIVLEDGKANPTGDQAN
ncbi:MAG TPA: C45 family autoproteolytic acyltransferase/hydrolase [Bryobacteraceae bacterium]|nr:C45 family autoproteolytic acyltransferase/hydrolase [Bryobacteraceae bacterium]